MRLRHVTAEGLSLFERSLLADGAAEDIASSEEPRCGLCEGQAFGGSATLLLDLLGAEPFRGLNAVVRVEGCLLLLSFLKEWQKTSLGVFLAHGRLSQGECFYLFDF